MWRVLRNSTTARVVTTKKTIVQARFGNSYTWNLTPLLPLMCPPCTCNREKVTIRHISSVTVLESVSRNLNMVVGVMQPVNIVMNVVLADRTIV